MIIIIVDGIVYFLEVSFLLVKFIFIIINLIYQKYINY